MGGGRSASPQSRMQAPLLTCYVASFQEKVGHVILRDVNTVQNASYVKIKYLKQAKQKKAEKQRNRKRTKAKQQKGKEAGKAEKQRSRKSREAKKQEKQKSKKAEKQRSRRSRKAKKQKRREAGEAEKQKSRKGEKQEKQRSRNPKIIPKPDQKRIPKIISPPYNNSIVTSRMVGPTHLPGPSQNPQEPRRVRWKLPWGDQKELPWNITRNNNWLRYWKCIALQIRLRGKTNKSIASRNF